MKKLGNSSLSSILLLITRITWWAECIFVGIVSALAIALLFAKKDLSFDAPVSFSPVLFRALTAKQAGTPQGHLNITRGIFYLPIECNWKTIGTMLVIFLIFFSLILLVTFQLKKIFASFSRNEPFMESNILRIRNIGLAVLSYPLLRFLFDAGLYRYLRARFTWTADLRLTYSFDFSTLLAGLILIVIAEIFRLGSELDNEQKLTI